MNLENLKELGYDYISNTSEYCNRAKLVGQFWDGDEQISKVYYFEEMLSYVQFNGYYSSYDGMMFSDCYEVEPEEYTATRYNPKKTVEFTVDGLLNDIRNIFENDIFKDSPVSPIAKLDGVSSCECIEEYDRDDYGAEAHRIYKIETITNQTIFVRVDGYYASYGGFELETVKLVEPKQKTITIYE